MTVNQIVIGESTVMVDCYEVISINLQAYSYGRVWSILNYYYDSQSTKIIVPKSQFDKFKASLAPLALLEVNEETMSMNKNDIFRDKCENVDRIIKSIYAYHNLLKSQLDAVKALCNENELMDTIAWENISLLWHLAKINNLFFNMRTKTI
jgi:hypothetical protein